MTEPKINFEYTLGRIDSNVDSILRRLDKMNEWNEKQESRIATLELSQARQKGEIKVWGIIAGFITSLAVGGIELLINKR